MTTHVTPDVDNPELILPRTRSVRVARLVSAVFSPSVMAVLSLVLIGDTVDTLVGWGWLGVYLVLGVGVPLGYIVHLVRSGQATDIDLKRREQRIRPFMLALACMVVLWVLAWLGAAPTLIRAIISISILQGLILFVVTLFWKISLHSASVATFVTLTVGLVGAMTLPLFLLVLWVMWSRVHLKRHTLMQTIAGTTMGVSTVVFALQWLI